MAASDASSVVDRLRHAFAGSGDVRLALLFGSRARDGARPDSDFDIGVLLDPAVAREDRGTVIRRLAGRLGRVVSSALIDIVVLDDAPALLRHRALRDGIVVFQRSPEERVRFAIRTIREYQDGQVRRERFTERRIERLKAGPDNGGSRDLLQAARRVARLLGKAPGVS